MNQSAAGTSGGRPDPIARRRADLEALAAGTWDVVIVGGGIVGSGALLDAASREHRVLSLIHI